MRSRSLLIASALVVLCVASAEPSTATVAGPRGAPAPRLARPVATAKPLVTRFFALTAAKNRRELAQFLSPAFQNQRADGSGGGKARFLATLPTIDAYSFSGMKATQAGPTLVVRYLATVEGIVNGRRYTPGPAPRLSVFSWNGRRWQLAAHANFNPLAG